MLRIRSYLNRSQLSSGVREQSPFDAMTNSMARLACAAAGALLGATACGDSPIVVCQPILYVTASIPDTVTIKVGASTLALAGATWGGCETGPPPPDFSWNSSDATIASVTALDSVHARIQGLRPGNRYHYPHLPEHARGSIPSQGYCRSLSSRACSLTNAEADKGAIEYARFASVLI
jgi:hypothetical protein